MEYNSNETSENFDIFRQQRISSLEGKSVMEYFEKDLKINSVDKQENKYSILA